MKIIEEVFEFCLFNARMLTLFAVIGSLVASFVMFAKGTMQIVSGVHAFYQQCLHFSLGAEHKADNLVAIFVESVDNYLFATVLLIFSMGLYELFVSKIDPASRMEDTRPNWLKINSLDDLKTSLGKVILMILVVAFFEHSLGIAYNSPLDLLYLAAGIILVSGALYLTHAGHKKEH
ncbi:MAG: YqhA family protein [Desulfovibrio sp.]|jgi:uncharacterized membrane protein YqhA|nr:YqhA family protein [Desulfovibrio sp.]